MSSNIPPSKKRTSGAGRKKLDPGLHTVKKTISLPPTTYENLMAVGGGKLSHGVQLVADFYFDNEKLTKGKP